MASAWCTASLDGISSLYHSMPPAGLRIRCTNLNRGSSLVCCEYCCGFDDYEFMHEPASLLSGGLDGRIVSVLEKIQ
nr:hypothetical protein CFP56_38816 [Quercus suber]